MVDNEVLIGAKKRFHSAACLPAASGWTGGPPQRRQVVAGFARNWAGVPRSQDAGGRSSKLSALPVNSTRQIGMTEILHQIQYGALETRGVALVRPVPKV